MVLTAGGTGVDVVYLQQRLQEKGFRPGKVDGVFGSQTLRAVRQFQAAHALKVDGVVGDRTWAALRAGPMDPLPQALIDMEKQTLLQAIRVSGDQRSVLGAAIETLGWREIPDGSNDGPEVGKIAGGYFSEADERAYGLPPWCALAVSYWLKEGLKAAHYRDIPFGTRFGAVSQVEAWAKTRDVFVVSRIATVAAQGSIFTMDRASSGSDPSKAIAAGHTGLVVEDLGDRVRTIEGNTGNAIASRERRKSSLRGWVDWW